MSRKRKYAPKPITPFIPVPKQLLTSELIWTLSPAGQGMFLYFLRHLKTHEIDERFRCSYETIREKTGFRYEKISKGIRELARNGIIEYTTKYKGPNEYLFNKKLFIQ